MVKTLGIGRMPRTGPADGLKVQVGSVTIGGTPGSFAVAVNTIRHMSMSPITTGPTDNSGSWYRAIPFGSTQVGYAYLNTMYVGTGAKPSGTTTAQAYSFMVYGE